MDRTRHWLFAAGRAEVRRVAACAVAVGFLTAACGWGANPSARTNEPSPASSARYLTYVDSTYGFRIEYPPDWTEDVGTGGAVVAFVSPAQSSSDDFRENLNVLVQDLPDPSMSLRQYTNLSLRQAGSIIDGFKVLASGRSTLAGRSAERVTYLGQSGTHDLKFDAVWMVEKGRAYVLTYTAAPDSFGTFRPMAEAMIESFRLG